jgi:hypothetical protein
VSRVIPVLVTGIVFLGGREEDDHGVDDARSAFKMEILSRLKLKMEFPVDKRQKPIYRL